MRTLKCLKFLKSHKKSYVVEHLSDSKDHQSTSVADKKEKTESWIKCRHSIVIVGFFIYFFINAYRINMSVTLVAMVNNSATTGAAVAQSTSCPVFLENASTNGNHTTGEYDSEDGELSWSPELQGYVLGSYYLSYMLVQIPFGKLVETYGSKWLLFWGSAVAAVATLTIPLVSRLHVYALIAVQFIRGIGQGFFQPASAVLIVNYLPKLERGLYYPIMQSGIAVGACLGSILSGQLCNSTLLGGWPSSFYAFGIAGLMLSCAIALFIYENPSVHPKISQEELKYILSNQETPLSQRRPNPPWRKMLTSIPVYALTFGYFGQMWAVAQFLIVQSTFLGTILHYPIRQNGVYSAIPFLFFFLCTLISSWLSTLAAKRNYATVDQARKFWSSVSCFGFSACLLGVYFAGCDRHWNIAFAVLSVGFMGFGISGVWIVAADMSPTSAATLNAICCTFGGLPTFILPLLVGYLTNEMQTIEQWNKIYFISIGVVMSSGVIFLAFGSAKIQPWISVEEMPNEAQERKTSY